MSYTQEDLERDIAKIVALSNTAKPTGAYEKVQWEMAKAHKAIIRYWDQVHKQFTTSAPVDDAENYLGFAQHWVTMVEVHHDLEEAVQFPGWNPPLDMSKNEEEHRELMVPLSAFKAYLAHVAAGAEPWSPTKAEALAQAFLPIFMHHFVAELYTLDAESIKSSGLTEEKLKSTHEAMAALARSKFDLNKDLPAILLHNDGDLEWPPSPWKRTSEFKMPPELYEHYKGWWKYAALSL